MIPLEEVKKKRGRPVTGCPKNNVIAVRTTEQTKQMLDEICKTYGASKSDILEKWVENQHKMMEMGIELM